MHNKLPFREVGPSNLFTKSKNQAQEFPSVTAASNTADTERASVTSGFGTAGASSPVLTCTIAAVNRKKNLQPEYVAVSSGDLRTQLVPMYQSSTVVNNADLQTSGVAAAEDEREDVESPPSKQKKLVKFGLLLALIVVIVYVVLDYTVSDLKKCTVWRRPREYPGRISLFQEKSERA